MIKPTEHTHPKIIIRWEKAFRISKLKTSFVISIFEQCDVCGFRKDLAIVECQNDPGWVYVE